MARCLLQMHVEVRGHSCVTCVTCRYVCTRDFRGNCCLHLPTFLLPATSPKLTLIHTPAPSPFRSNSELLALGQPHDDALADTGAGGSAAAAVAADLLSEPLAEAAPRESMDLDALPDAGEAP